MRKKWHLFDTRTHTEGPYVIGDRERTGEGRGEGRGEGSKVLNVEKGLDESRPETNYASHSYT